MRISKSDLDFVESEAARNGEPRGTVAYRIFECGMRFYLAECSNDITKIDVTPHEGGAS